MASEVQRSGIDVVGDVSAWGAHFSLFYETREDLLDTQISYCKSGLQRGEYCLWIVAEPLTIEQAKEALKDAVPDLDRHLADSRMEFAPARDFFLQGGTFDGKRLTADLYDKLASLSARGYPGIRVTGDTRWLTKKDWPHFCAYEAGLNEAIGNKPLAVLCAYPLTQCGAPEILDVVRTHQFVLARRYGTWEVVETAALKRAKADIARLNEELEQRVTERTKELVLAQAALAHANRVATMGQLSASIGHEISQPLSGVVTSAETAMLWLRAEQPNIDEALRALARVVRDGKRVNDVISRIRALIKKVPPQKGALDINEAILEVVGLTHGEAEKNGVVVQTQLWEQLPLIQGDRVQLQQVILNLTMNAVEAMSALEGGRREVLISTTEIEPDGSIVVAVRDSGPGLDPANVERIFSGFYTTKPDGLGMGLSICRSIIEAHGGRLWATACQPQGALFQFMIPARPT